MKIEFFCEESDIEKLKDMRNSIDEEIEIEQSDITEMCDTDISIAAIEFNDKRIEICTTNDRYNLYCLEDSKINGSWETVDATNISYIIDDWDSYESVCRYLLSFV